MSAGAKVGSTAYYSPFVEFGTGPSFQIPYYRNLNMNKLLDREHIYNEIKTLLEKTYATTNNNNNN